MQNFELRPNKLGKRGTPMVLQWEDRRSSHAKILTQSNSGIGVQHVASDALVIGFIHSLQHAVLIKTSYNAILSSFFLDWNSKIRINFLFHDRIYSQWDVRQCQWMIQLKQDKRRNVFTIVFFSRKMSKIRISPVPLSLLRNCSRKDYEAESSHAMTFRKSFLKSETAGLVVLIPEIFVFN